MRIDRWNRAGAAVAVVALLGAAPPPPPIDRHALVERHAVVLTRVDPHAPVMLGNGELGFTADITGLQTFPDAYAPTAPLLTMAAWAWHSFPEPPGGAGTGDVAIAVPGRGKQPFAYIADLAAAAKDPRTAWLRENPHRFSLGRIALALRHRDGRPVALAELTDTTQRLDLWTGTLISRFRLDGQAVTVTTRVASPEDAVLVDIASPLVATGGVGIDVAFPGIGHSLNPDPSDWTHPKRHRTTVTARAAGRLSLVAAIDATRYAATIVAPGAAVLPAGAHRVAIRARGGDRLTASIGFASGTVAPPAPAPGAAARADARWRDYWQGGAAIDLSATRDPRAAELERRIVLSQYLAAINEAGRVPPQEEGLFSNSWNGKFHLEMMAWHAGHFAMWNRPALLERGLGWYLDHLPQAIAQGRRHGLTGAAWWPKMAGPEGRNSPSPINPFIFGHQPEPIHLAELIRLARPGAATLARYGALVDATARTLAGWVRLDASDGRYHLGPPIVPVQENHDPFTTRDPAFELSYFRWALGVAQQWRVTRGLPRERHWDDVIARMAPVPQVDGLYAPVASEPDFWRLTRSPACRGDATGAGCRNRDHPSFLMSWGFVGDDRINAGAMARTLDATREAWDWRQVWGWDFPMIAMTAARLGRRDEAVDWLLRDAVNNRWGPTGMTPRFDVDADAAAPRRVADTYFPSNGSLLAATAMMAAGWRGSHGQTPGFPADWTVRAEGFAPSAF